MNISVINVSTNVYSSSKQLTILSYFLTDDIGGRNIESLISWLKDDKYESAVLNYSYIKKDKGKIKIYCFYDGYEREESDDRNKFETEISDLIRIAQEWQELYKKYFYIKIIEEKGSIVLVGTRKK